MAAIIKNISRTNRVSNSPDVTFGDVTYLPGGTFGSRMQPDFQIVAMHEGDAVITVDGTKHALPCRHVALLKPAHREYFAFSRGTAARHTWCAVHPRRVPPPLARELTGAPFSLPLSPRLHALIELGLSSPRSNSPAMSALIEKLGDVLLQQYLVESEPGSTQTVPLPEPLRRAKARIEESFAATISVPELAKVACCTSNHLTKLFRRYLGITPSRYLWQTRTDHGIELLRHTGLSISEISYRCGFQTPFHFSRLVKARQGFSPKELRARTWNSTR